MSRELHNKRVNQYETPDVKFHDTIIPGGFPSTTFDVKATEFLTLAFPTGNSKRIEHPQEVQNCNRLASGARLMDTAALAHQGSAPDEIGMGCCWRKTCSGTSEPFASLAT